MVAKESLKSMPDANVLIHDAKRENVYLQLEAALRERMHTVHTEVKKRLDYQVALNNVHARVEREQAINYIIDGVRSSIGANQVSYLNKASQLKFGPNFEIMLC